MFYSPFSRRAWRSDSGRNMVLSKKKLKQKLRATLSEHPTVLVPGEKASDVDTSGLDLNSRLRSSKDLLSSTTKKRKSSRKEKRKGISNSTINDLTNGKDVRDVEDVEVEVQARELVNSRKKERKNECSAEFDGRKYKSKGSPEGINTKQRFSEGKKKRKKHKIKVKSEAYNTNSVAETVEDLEQVLTDTPKIGDSSEIDDALKRIFVGGIPYCSTEDDIRSYFEGCGTVMEVDCKKFLESGKFRGIAIITFKTEAAAKRALALDGNNMGGLYLKIQPYKAPDSKMPSLDFSPEIVSGYRRIYVGNLSWDITEEDLKKLFCDCTVSAIKLGMDKETGNFRGYAHVDFADELSFMMALKLDQEVVCGRPVRIRCAVSNKSSHANRAKDGRSNGSCSTPDGLGHGKKKRHVHNSSFDHGGRGSENGALAGSGDGKKKRRMCYLCRIPGHLSYSCPKKQTGTNSTQIM